MTEEDMTQRLAETSLETQSSPPPPPPEVTNDDSGAENETTVQLEAGAQTGKKKKRSKRKKAKVTGFEDNYDDGPITPDIAAQESVLYDLSRPSSRRLEIAIQRFRMKRRLDNERLNIFLKYLNYGGIDIKQNQFGGVSEQDLKYMDNEQIMDARAPSRIPENREGWDIDFERVLKGFFSNHIYEFYAMDTYDLVKKATGTISNFLNYIMYHKVCPEHEANIMKARAVCDVAQSEIYKTVQFIRWAPGDFNTACATLFGGKQNDMPGEETDWNANENYGSEAGASRMPDDIARKVMRFTIAGAGDEEQATRFKELAETNQLRAMKLVDVAGFEITEITPPDDELRQFYEEFAPDLQRVGKVRARSWNDPALRIDLPPGEEEELGTQEFEEFEFFLEESVLRYCFIGMKVASDVWVLNCGGLYYFDFAYSAKCSFYAPLWNDYMIEYKEPKAMEPGEEEANEIIFDGQARGGVEVEHAEHDAGEKTAGQQQQQQPRESQEHPQTDNAAEDKENETPSTEVNGKAAQSVFLANGGAESEQQQQQHQTTSTAPVRPEPAGDGFSDDEDDDITNEVYLENERTKEQKRNKVIHIAR